MNTQAIAKTGQIDALELALQAIERDPSLQPSTRDQYTKAVKNAAAAGVDLTNPQALNEYAQTVGTSSRAFLSAVITKMTQELEHLAKTNATPDNVAAVQATIYRAEALREAVKSDQATNGTKAHTWLNQAQVKELLEACEIRRSGNPEFEIVAQRDRLAIGLLVAAGLRRKEAVDLTFDDVKLQPNGDRMRTVLEIHGKGDKGRVVPISDTLANAIDSWAAVVGNEGRILRSLGRSKTPGDSMTTTALYDLVQKRGELIGKPDLQPHDLRRTFAQLGYEAGIPITQLSQLLGHASIETTQRYLNLELDLGTTASDFIPFFG